MASKVTRLFLAKRFKKNKPSLSQKSRRNLGGGKIISESESSKKLVDLLAYKDYKNQRKRVLKDLDITRKEKERIEETIAADDYSGGAIKKGKAAPPKKLTKSDYRHIAAMGGERDKIAKYLKEKGVDKLTKTDETGIAHAKHVFAFLSRGSIRGGEASNITAQRMDKRGDRREQAMNRMSVDETGAKTNYSRLQGISAGKHRMSVFGSDISEDDIIKNGAAEGRNAPGGVVRGVSAQRLTNESNKVSHVDFDKGRSSGGANSSGGTPPIGFKKAA